MALVDELGAIQQRLKVAKPDIDREDEIKKQLRGLMDSSPADAAASFAGKTFVASISERRFESSVDSKKAFKALGVRLFLKLARIAVKALESDDVPYAKRFGLVVKEQIGPRIVTTQFKNVPQEALKKVA